MSRLLTPPVGVPTSQFTDPGQFPGALMHTLGSYGRAVTVTAHATPHAKGAWTEIIAATSADATHLVVAPYGTSASATDTRALLDIGVGAAASEVAILSEIPAGFIGASLGESNSMAITFPVSVPKGSRVSARLQALIGGDTATVAVYCLSMPGGRSPSALVTIGADTAASTSASFMTVSDTYAQITGSTSQPFRGLIAVPCGGASAGWTNDAAESLTLAVGASGAETALASSPLVTWNNQETLNPASISLGGGAAAFVSRHIPAGTRIACKITTGRSYKGVIVFGVPYA